MKILGYNYKILHKSKKDMESLGLCRYGKLQIHISKKQAPQQKESTVLHEMIHAISYHLHLELSEQQIMALESGLYQALIDNGINLTPLTRELE